MTSKNSWGTVLLYGSDSGQSPLSRIWVVFEAHIANEQRYKGLENSHLCNPYYYDFMFPDAMLQDATGQGWELHGELSAIESAVVMGCAVNIVKADSSKEEDRRRILNFITTGVADPKQKPDMMDDKLETLSEFVRTPFASIALMMACMSGDSQKALSLLKRSHCEEVSRQGTVNQTLTLRLGADPNKFGANGNSPLLFELSLTQPCYAVVAELIKANANVNHARRDRSTALDLAYRLAHDVDDRSAMIDLLEQHGAKPFADIKDELAFSINIFLKNVMQRVPMGEMLQCFDSGSLSKEAQRWIRLAMDYLLNLHPTLECTLGLGCAIPSSRKCTEVYQPYMPEVKKMVNLTTEALKACGWRGKIALRYFLYKSEPNSTTPITIMVSWPAIEEEEQDLLDKSLVRTIKVSSPGGTAASRLRAMSQGGSSDSIEAAEVEDSIVKWLCMISTATTPLGSEVSRDKISKSLEGNGEEFGLFLDESGNVGVARKCDFGEPASPLTPGEKRLDATVKGSWISKSQPSLQPAGWLRRDHRLSPDLSQSMTMSSSLARPRSSSSGLGPKRRVGIHDLPALPPLGE
eukprot:TRINITY_DN35125_c0_g1_i1.p1 TRINITY_DN35125_c0_g1~~TRINITY_DN35125_c0_g1_i1.p1  ORF type:complete len:622 (-),score=96.61 TRINITY_DN35125_c0_g1_i1:118-1851(-)